MPTSLDDIKYQQHNNSCQSVHEHVNDCQLCKELYNPPNTTNLTSVRPVQTTPSSVWIISIVLIIFVGIFIYQKFI